MKKLLPALLGMAAIGESMMAGMGTPVRTTGTYKPTYDKQTTKQIAKRRSKNKVARKSRKINRAN